VDGLNITFLNFFSGLEKIPVSQRFALMG